MSSESSSSSSTTSSLNKLFIGILIYISTGIAQPILIDALRIHSLLGHKYLLLPTLANTTGMALCGFLASTQKWSDFKMALYASSSQSSSSSNSSSSKHKEGNKNNLKRMIMLAAFVDLISGMCLTFGILLTGGAIFVILYNSCPAWTAMLSKFVLGKTLGTVQILGVVLVCIGLVTNVLGTKVSSLHDDGGESKEGEDANNETVYTGAILGSIVVLVGSLLHSLMFVISDWVLCAFQCDNHTTTTNDKVSNDTSSISGEIWSCCLGTIEAIFMSIWVLVGIFTTGFHGEDWVPPSSDNTSSSSIDGNIYYVIGGFALLVIVDAVHAASFFALLKNIGAVASALLKGLQMVVVIALSAFFFCARESSQCLTYSKGLSAFLVMIGVISYGLGAKKGKKDISTDKRMTEPSQRRNESVEMKKLINQ